jgi:hypothetical protein
MDTPRQPHPPCFETEGCVAIFCMAYLHNVLESKSLGPGSPGLATLASWVLRRGDWNDAYSSM